MEELIDTNKKILLVSGGLKGGGMERALTNLANFASELGYQITILNLFKTEVFFDLHPNIQVVWPSLDREKMSRLTYAFRLLPFIRKSIREIKPDTILSFGEWFNSYVLLAARGLPFPVFVSDRMGPDLHLGFMLESARKLTYRFATGIIAQTHIAASKIRKKTGAHQIEIIPNAVRTIDVSPSPKSKQIITVGRLSPEKGHIHLIRAFAKLPFQDWTLHIVGDGSERLSLEQECKVQHIADRVIFYGYRKDFSDLYAISDIFVLPSLYEGFPNALLEAMSVPLVCVSSDCVAGPSEIITNDVNGFLIPPANEEALSLILSKIILDEELRNRISSSAFKVREDFSFELLAKKYINYILR